jgi:antitoxin component YwqK of YwqJK toxin-antitoxin module
MMKTLLTILILLTSFAVRAQEMELYEQFIKKQKRKYCQAFSAVGPSGAQGTPYLSATWEFDQEGRNIMHHRFDDKNALIVKMWKVFDPTNKLVSSEKDNERMQEHERIDYVYDGKGRLLEEIEYRDSALVVTYKHFYGKEGRKDSTIWIDALGKPTLYEHYTYNEKGWLIEQVEKTPAGKPDGRTVYEYHEDGTLKYETLYDVFGDAFEKIVYNDMGFPIKREISYLDYTVSHDFEYDKKGFLVKMTKSRTDQPNSTETMSFKWLKSKPKK